jgi:branched-chain amino acid transport system substrate-binding protein
MQPVQPDIDTDAPTQERPMNLHRTAIAKAATIALQPLLGMLLLAALQPAAAQERQVVTIAHAAPTSGPGAAYGKDNENGVRMAIDELNHQGLVIGGKKIDFVLAVEDDAGEARQATIVAQKFCDMRVAGVVGHLTSGTSMAASRVYNACGIPHVTGSATLPGLTQQGYNTTFRVIANDFYLGTGMAIYAADVLKLKRVAILEDRSTYGQGIVAVFKKEALARGITIVGEEYTTMTSVDFMAVLTSIKSKNPEAIFFGGLAVIGGPVLRQMEQLGMSDIKFLGGDGICVPDLVTLAAGAKAVDNVFCAQAGVSMAKMAGGGEWKKQYDSQFPGAFRVYSPYTYDATHVLVDAMKRANSVDPKVYVSRLLETNYRGITSQIAFDANGDLKTGNVTFNAFKNGTRMALN